MPACLLVPFARTVDSDCKVDLGAANLLDVSLAFQNECDAMNAARAFLGVGLIVCFLGMLSFVAYLALKRESLVFRYLTIALIGLAGTCVTI